MNPSVSTLAGIALLTLCGVANANGINEDGDWQFKSSTDRANQSYELNIQQQKAGGFYDSYQSNYNINCAAGSIACGGSANGTGALGAYSSTSNIGNQVYTWGGTATVSQSNAGSNEGTGNTNSLGSVTGTPLTTTTTVGH